MAQKIDPAAAPPLLARWQWLKRLETQGFKPLLALCALVCAMGLLYLYQNSTLVTTTYAIARLEATRTQLLRRHEQLQAEAAQLESLTRVRREAVERLGMVPATEVRYLLVANLPAEQPTVHAFAPGVPAGPATSTTGDAGSSVLSDLWQIVVNQFMAWGGQQAGPEAQAR